MTEERRSQIEVKVGRWMPDGTFTGETLTFTGEEVGSYTDYSMAQSRDDRGITYTLYRVPPSGDEAEGGEARYRAYVEEWSRRQGEDSSAALHPFEEREDPYGREPLAYTMYSEAEARGEWPELFAAVGMPNTRDID